MADFNYAAFGWRDILDARRGHPKHDLRAYAEARGLEFAGSRPPRGYETILPSREGQIFNVVAGMLSGGRPGVIAHERLRVPAAGGKPPQGGGWWGVSYSSRPGESVLRPDLGDILDPLDLTHDLVDALDPTDLLSTDLSDLIGGGRAEPADVAFLVPCTVAASRAADVHLGFAGIRIDRRWRVPPRGFDQREDLKSHGLDGWHLQAAGGEVGGEWIGSLLTPELRRLLEESKKGFLQLIVAGGAVVARRGGFAKEDAELDRLSEALATFATAARGVAEPQPDG